MEVPEHDASFIRSGIGLMRPDMSFTLYITQQSNHWWTAHHFVSEYRCILRGELSKELEFAGFRDVQWIMPVESDYYQPIVVAKWG